MDVVLVEGCDRAEALPRSDVALSPADPSVIKLALNGFFVVHGEAGLRVDRRVQGVVVLDGSRATLDALCGSPLLPTVGGNGG